MSSAASAVDPDGVPDASEGAVASFAPDVGAGVDNAVDDDDGATAGVTVTDAGAGTVEPPTTPRAAAIPAAAIAAAAVGDGSGVAPTPGRTAKDEVAEPEEADGEGSAGTLPPVASACCCCCCCCRTKKASAACVILWRWAWFTAAENAAETAAIDAVDAPLNPTGAPRKPPPDAAVGEDAGGRAAAGGPLAPVPPGTTEPTVASEEWRATGARSVEDEGPAGGTPVGMGDALE